MGERVVRVRTALPGLLRWSGIALSLAAIGYVGLLARDWYLWATVQRVRDPVDPALLALALSPLFAQVWLFLVAGWWVARAFRRLDPARVDFAIWTACGVAVVAWYSMEHALEGVPYYICVLF